MKKIICGILIVAIIASFFTFTTSGASKANYKIDNDTVDNTFMNRRSGFDIYVTGSSHYNGDCRRQLSSNANAYYEWRKKSDPVYSKDYPIYVTVGVYLNNTRFTDTRAHYHIIQEDDRYLINILDHNTARAGWTYFDATFNWNNTTPNEFTVYGLAVTPSGLGNGLYTGADAIHINAEAG